MVPVALRLVRGVALPHPHGGGQDMSQAVLAESQVVAAEEAIHAVYGVPPFVMQCLVLETPVIAECVLVLMAAVCCVC